MKMIRSGGAHNLISKGSGPTMMWMVAMASVWRKRFNVFEKQIQMFN